MRFIQRLILMVSLIAGLQFAGSMAQPIPAVGHVEAASVSLTPVTTHVDLLWTGAAGDFTNPAAGDLGAAAPAASLGPLVESPLVRVDGLTLEPGEDKAWSAVIDSAAGFAYFGMDTTPGIVVKVRLSDFTRVGALTLNEDEVFVDAAVIDPAGGFAYFGTDTVPGKVVKVRLSDFTRVDALTLDPAEGYVNSAVIDPASGFAYFGTDTTPGIVVKVQLSDFTRVGALTLNAGEDRLLMATIDPAAGYAYFGTHTNPGGVVKVRLSNFTREAALTFDPYEPYPVTSVIDVAHGFLYFGLNTDPQGVVVKVQLSDFTRVDALTLNSGEAYPNASLIDPAGGYAYFGTFTSPGIVVRVRLSDFTRVDALTLNTGEDDLFSAVMDPAQGFAYFGTLTSPGIVVKIDLANRLYVDANANGANDGSSWANAFTSLTWALSAASTGDTIWMAAGVYKPIFTGLHEPTTNSHDPFATFELVDGVSIYGGFPPGGGNGTFAARKTETYVTVLSGDVDNNDTVDANGVVVDPSGIVGANSYRVVTGSFFSSPVILDGLTITGGSNVQVETPQGAGMALYSADLVLQNLTFRGNVAPQGGALYVAAGSSPTISHSAFINNRASLYGGGAITVDTSSLAIDATVFSGNDVDGEGIGGGGAIQCENCNLLVQQSAFEGNFAPDGGAIDLPDILPEGFSTLTVDSSTFSNNSAYSGGAINVGEGSSQVEVKNSTISKNSGYSGGGISAVGDVTVINSTIAENDAKAGGGIVDPNNGVFSIINLSLIHI